MFAHFSLMLLCSWYKLMEANYNKILGIQKCKQRARNKLRTMCKIQKTRIQQEEEVSDNSITDIEDENEDEETEP